MLIRLFMVCEIAHFEYNGATVWIVIHRQLSAPIRKSFPILSCHYDQIHNSTSSTSLAYIYRGTETLCKRWACVVRTTQYTTQCMHFQWLRKNFISKLASLKSY